MYSFVDTHCDTAVKAYERDERLFENSLHLDMKRMLGYGVPVQVFAIWLHKKYYNDAFEQTKKRIEFYHQELKENNGIIRHANSFIDIQNNKKNNRISGLLSIEGAEALEGDIKKLHYFHEAGVRAITLTWNYGNCVGNGAGVKRCGLTEFGRQVVKEMERLNILVDVSHLNDDGFWEVVEITERPFFASHSNSRKQTNVKRNLTDSQLKAIANKGGMVGLNLCSIFLTRNNESTINDILSHIDHMGKVIGFDYIGFGFDFDGIDDTPREVGGVEDIIKIMQAIEKKYGESIAAKISEENFLNYFRQWLHGN